MKTRLPLLFASLLTLASCGHEPSTPLYKDASAPIDRRISDLMSRMSVTDKVGQLLCPLGWPMYEKDSLGQAHPSELYVQRMNEMPLGGCWAVMRADPWTQKTLETGLHPAQAADLMNQLQRYAVEQTPLGIPLLFTEEAVHGHMAIGTTVFPTGLGVASTFDPALIHDMAEAVALEVRSQGGQVGYGPVLDLARDPRWGRMEETMGEEPYLTATLGEAIVRGMQGDDPADGRHLYSTLKHFAAYGTPEAGQNGGQSLAGERQIRSEYLPAFERAIAAGAQGVMTSYNVIDGVPCTANPRLLTDLLREEWGFEGVVYSDLVSIVVMANTHHIYKDYREAAEAALLAGVNIDLQGDAFGANIASSIEQLEQQDPKRARALREALDRSVARVLRLKFRMGLFENPYVDPEMAARVVRSEEHRQLARQVAREGIVLLKNDGLLPLSNDIRRVAVIGPNADMPYNQLGDYTAPQEREAIATVLDGVRERVPGAQVSYVKGCAIRDTRGSEIARAVQAARSADVTILVVGGSSARDFRTSYKETGAAEASQTLSDMETGEGMDRCDLTLMGDQQRLMEALVAAGVKLVVVYIEGRPLDMNLASERANALLTAWYPGEQGGRAIADVLWGDYNPSGRLPVSIPRSVGQLPIYYSRAMPHDYADGAQTPLYPFGYGLSYTRFGYSDLRVTVTDANLTNPQVEVRCTVTNEGEHEGDEVVQLYLNDEVSSVKTPERQLRGFERIHLLPGESRDVTFHLGFRDLALWDREMHRVVEPGTFRVSIKPSTPESLELSEHFEL